MSARKVRGGASAPRSSDPHRRHAIASSAVRAVSGAVLGGVVALSVVTLLDSPFLAAACVVGLAGLFALLAARFADAFWETIARWR